MAEPTSSSSSSGTARRGAQEPRIRVEPPYSYTDGPDAAKLYEQVGPALRPWQRLVLDGWLSRCDDDRLIQATGGMSAPRQNGKTFVVEPRELYTMANGGHVLHTAHQVKTANKSFNHLADLLTRGGGNPFRKLVDNVRRTNGEQAIWFANGGSVEYAARSRGSARGFDNIELVILDEAQELTDEQLEALMSTLSASASGDRQMLYIGTPPGPACPGDVFRRMRANAIKSPTPRESWYEWSVAEIGDVHDRDRWYATNPSMGYQLTEDFTEVEASKLSRDGFARERLGWWSEQGANTAIRQAVWEGSYTDEPPESGKKSFGVKFSPDGATVALAACRVPDGAPAHVELVDARPVSEGTGWLSELLNSAEPTTACVVVDGRSGADDLLSRLDEYPARALVTPGTRGVVAAATMTVSALSEHRLTHWRSPGQHALDESATKSVKRPIGNDGGYGFGGDVSVAIEAASLAYWGCMTTKRDPEGGCEVI